jgi:hypothetical protein
MMATAASLLCGSALAQWTPQFEAGFLHDTNLSRAQQPEDRVSDSALVARAAISRSFAAGEDADFNVGADARITAYDKSRGASFAALGVNVGWRKKLGLGLQAPWIALDASIAYENAREDIRDGTRGVVSFSTGRRFGQALQASAGSSYDKRVQREDYAEEAPGYGGKPFSLQGHSLFARADYAVGDRLSVIASAAQRYGDVVSSTRRNFAIFNAANAIADDPAFGDDFIAYRLSGARTRSLTGGLSWELARRATLDATLTKDDTRVGGGLDYGAVIFAVTFVYRK